MEISNNIKMLSRYEKSISDGQKVAASKSELYWNIYLPIGNDERLLYLIDDKTGDIILEGIEGEE